jgi:endonuclease/exonuclease/phosphatase family metal-dependent hydrolase
MEQYCNFGLVGRSIDINVSLYRSLNSRPEAMDTLVELVRKTDKNSVVFGDFNLPGIDWERQCTGSRPVQSWTMRGCWTGAAGNIPDTNEREHS